MKSIIKALSITAPVRIVFILGVLGLLTTLLAVLPVFGAVQGVVFILKSAAADETDSDNIASWVTDTGSIFLRVNDSDLNVPSAQTDQGNATTGLAGNDDNNDTVPDYMFAIKVGSNVAGTCTLDGSATLVDDPVRVSVFPLLDNTSDGVVNFADVTFSFVTAPTGTLFAFVFSVAPTDGLVDLNVNGQLASIAEADLNLSGCTGAGDHKLFSLTYKALAVDTEGAAEDPPITSIVTVKSQADAAGIGVVVTETGASTDKFEQELQLCNTTNCSDHTSSPPKLEVGRSDVVTFTYADQASVTVSTTVRVETNSPTFSNASPAHKFATQSPLPTASIDIIDTDSGVNKKDIRFLFNVPGTGSSVEDPNLTGTVTASTGGFSASQRLSVALIITDGDVLWWAAGTTTVGLRLDNAGNAGVSDRKPAFTLTGTVTTAAASRALTGTGTKFTTELEVGDTVEVPGETQRTVAAIASDASLTVGVAFAATAGPLTARASTCIPANFAALVTATTVGATDFNDAGCDPHVIKIDNTAPALAAAITGSWWDPDKTGTDKTETDPTKAKDTSVRVDFDGPLDRDSVDAADFRVAGNTPLAVGWFSGRKETVFLTVPAQNPDARPRVELVAEVRDTAGNANSSGEIEEAEDGIARTAQPSEADIGITKADSPDSLFVGENLTYTLTVTNKGPSTASGVTLTDTLPGIVNFVSVDLSKGSCSESGGTLTCNLDTLANDASATVTIVVTPNAAGTISNTASVTGNESDPDAADNVATEETTVLPVFGPAQGAVFILKSAGADETDFNNIASWITDTGSVFLRVNDSDLNIASAQFDQGSTTTVGLAGNDDNGDATPDYLFAVRVADTSTGPCALFGNGVFTSNSGGNASDPVRVSVFPLLDNTGDGVVNFSDVTATLVGPQTGNLAIGVFSVGVFSGLVDLIVSGQLGAASEADVNVDYAGADCATNDAKLFRLAYKASAVDT